MNKPISRLALEHCVLVIKSVLAGEEPPTVPLIETYPRYKILASYLTVRKNPEAGSQVLGYVSSPAEVEVRMIIGSYGEIQFQDGIGWIRLGRWTVLV